MDEKNYTIDIENLSVRYETADGVVEAVNGIDLKIERGKLWVWWERLVQERPQRLFLFCA